MARPKKPDGEVKDQRVPLVMSPSELNELDDWMHENRIRSRGEAIRRLCQMGMAAGRDKEVVGDRLIMLLDTVSRLRGKVARIRDEKDRDIITKRIDAFAADFVLWSRDALKMGINLREYSEGASFEEASAAANEMLSELANISFADAEAIKREEQGED